MRNMGSRVATRQSRTWPRYTIGAVATFLLWATLLLAPVRDRISETALTPLPGFVPGAVDALVVIVNAIRWVSPFIAVAAVIGYVTFTLVGRTSERAGTLNTLASIEYAGVDHVESTRRSHPPLVDAVRNFVGGTGLAVLAVVLVGATSGIEHEVTNGPLRPIEALTDVLGGGEVSYVFQSPAITFMDDSAIPVDQMERFAAVSTSPVVPFGKHLFNLDGGSALQLSVPTRLYERLTGRPESSVCDERTVIVDDTVGAQAGDNIRLNGVRLTVAGVKNGIAQMNRSIAVLSDATVRECIVNGTSTSYFGALVGSAALDQVSATLDAADVDGIAVSEADFLENNRGFWRANATPLILQLILYIALFSGFAAAGERQSSLQRNSREIGMLHATGVDFNALQAVERRRALRTTLKAALLAAPLMVPVAAAFNASELGVHISVGLTELCVGFSLALVAMLLASQRALTRFRKSLDLPLAVKG